MRVLDWFIKPPVKATPIVPVYSAPMEMIARFLANGQVVWFDNNAEGNIKEGFLGNHIIFTIQDWKSSKVASAPPLVYEIKDEKTYRKYRAFLADASVDSFRRSQDMKIKALEEIEGHDMQKVLDRPNPHMSRYEFEYGLQTYVDIVGSGYYMGVRDGIADPEKGKITEMYLPPAHHMTIHTGDINNPIKEWSLSSNPDKKISAANVCQVRNFSPRYETASQWMYGLSRLFSAKGIIQKYKDGAASEIGIYQNNGRQDIIFPKDAVDPNEYSLEQMQGIRDAISSKLKSGGISTSTIELGSIRIGFSPTELGILESLQDAKVDLCALYHVPPELFAWGEHSTYNNMTEKRKIGLTDAVLPELEKRKDALNHWLVPSYAEKSKAKLVIDYDYEYFPELQADNAEIVKWMQYVPLTANERRALFKYDSKRDQNADKLMVQTNLTLLEDMGLESFPGNPDDNTFGGNNDGN